MHSAERSQIDKRFYLFELVLRNTAIQCLTCSQVSVKWIGLTEFHYKRKVKS